MRQGKGTHRAVKPQGQDTQQRSRPCQSGVREGPALPGAAGAVLGLFRGCFGAHLTEQGQFVIWQEPVGLVQQEISPDELLEAPVLALHEAIGALALCGTGRP